MQVRQSVLILSESATGGRSECFSVGIRHALPLPTHLLPNRKIRTDHHQMLAEESLIRKK